MLLLGLGGSVRRPSGYDRGISHGELVEYDDISKANVQFRLL